MATPETDASEFDPVAARREVPVNRDLALQLVRSHFPQLGAVQITWLGSGWDNDAFLVDDAWVFRFPKRASVLPWLERECRLTDLLRGRLGVTIPHFELRAEPSDAFALPFVGYRRVPGVGGDLVPNLDEPDAALVLGRAMSELHGTTRAAADFIPVAEPDDQPEAWAAALLDKADLVRSLLPTDLRPQAEPFLQREDPCPKSPGDVALLHGDVCPDHVLADQDTGRVTGLIDFADAQWGDPAVDFSGLWMWRGREFVERVLRQYVCPLDSEFPARLAWLTRVLSLMYLAEAAEQAMGSENLDKHRLWVRRAFETD